MVVVIVVIVVVVALMVVVGYCIEVVVVDLLVVLALILMIRNSSCRVVVGVVVVVAVVVVLVLLVEGSKLVVVVVSAFLVFDMLSLFKIHVLVGTISIKQTRTARKRYVSSQKDGIIQTYIRTYINAFIFSPQPAYMGSICFSIQIWPKVTL